MYFASLFRSLPISCAVTISICHPLLLVSCNDRMGLDYATTLTQALLQVLAMLQFAVFFPLRRLNSRSHALYFYCHLIPTQWVILFPFSWESQRPMRSQSSPFPCTSVVRTLAPLL